MNYITCRLLFRSDVVAVICKRFRKPPWVPPAPSKMFRIPKPRPMEENAKRELDEHFTHYNMQMSSLCSVIKSQSKEGDGSNSAMSGSLSAQKAEENDMQKRFAINDAWNKEISTKRLEWMAAADSAERENRLKIKIDMESVANVDRALVDDFLINLQEETQDLIKADEIESAIEAALDNAVDYNFAIDGSGNVFKHGEMVTNLLLPSRKAVDDVI